jgi:hypothetical protein
MEKERKMTAVEGEILKNRFTEDLHIVRRIGNSRVVLGNENGSVWISVRKKDLELYYERTKGGDAS